MAGSSRYMTVGPAVEGEKCKNEEIATNELRMY